MAEPLLCVPENALITGWDFSTGSVKCLAFDLSGNVVAEVRFPTDLWTEGGVGPALVDRVAQPEFVELSGGWQVWDSSADAPDGEPHGLYGVPVSALIP